MRSRRASSLLGALLLLASCSLTTPDKLDVIHSGDDAPPFASAANLAETANTGDTLAFLVDAHGVRSVTSNQVDLNIEGQSGSRDLALAPTVKGFCGEGLSNAGDELLAGLALERTGKAAPNPHSRELPGLSFTKLVGRLGASGGFAPSWSVKAADLPDTTLVLLLLLKDANQKDPFEGRVVVLEHLPPELELVDVGRMGYAVFPAGRKVKIKDVEPVEGVRVSCQDGLLLLDMPEFRIPSPQKSHFLVELLVRLRLNDAQKTQ